MKPTILFFDLYDPVDDERERCISVMCPLCRAHGHPQVHAPDNQWFHEIDGQATVCTASTIHNTSWTRRDVKPNILGERLSERWQRLKGTVLNFIKGGWPPR